MIDIRIKCDPEILFKITKKEAEFVKKLPRHQQVEFGIYLKLKHKFEIIYNQNSYLNEDFFTLILDNKEI